MEVVRKASVLLAFVLSACGGTVPGGTPPPAGGTGRFRLVVLGAAQDGGLPHLGCARACCEAARRDGRRIDPTSLGVVDTKTGARLLVEATPQVEAQVARLHRVAGLAQRPRRPVDAVILTHAHIGHYAGLVEFGREAASTDHLPVWVTERMATFLRNNGPWDLLVRLGQIELRVVRDGEPFEPLPGLRVTPIVVPHRQEYSDTIALRLAGSERTVLFASDVDRWEDGLLERLLDGVDVAYLDGTFRDGRELPGRDLPEIPHPPIVTTVERLASRARARPGALRFIHLNHTNPLWTDDALLQQLERAGFGVAEQEESFRF
ncbi:MAG: pyrroloquinoline quinone biosynthesis protein PqqB [Acidobacteriota bacterium]